MMITSRFMNILNDFASFRNVPPLDKTFPLSKEDYGAYIELLNDIVEETNCVPQMNMDMLYRLWDNIVPLDCKKIILKGLYDKIHTEKNTINLSDGTNTTYFSDLVVLCIKLITDPHDINAMNIFHIMCSIDISEEHIPSLNAVFLEKVFNILPEETQLICVDRLEKIIKYSK